MPYDRYPETWQSGACKPNLQSFGEDVVRIGAHKRVDCFIFGSRGGQVVLPILWRELKNDAPPSVVVNGGCAARLPGPRVYWPASVVTVMLLGGQDFFRSGISRDEYLNNTLQCVGDTNQTTAFLFVPEMKHMPQEEVMRASLRHFVLAALAWKKVPERFPADHLDRAAEALLHQGFANELFYKSGGGWCQKTFGRMPLDRQPPPLSPRIPRPPGDPCPPHTAVSVLPAKVAVGDSKAGWSGDLSSDGVRGRQRRPLHRIRP
ncbi:Hypothetical protein SCF082_LOCUS30189 [Durusdinium trenchii]|uniref:Uncharacterized protein n=1 Tax=Durusdinium trenchii TaxID=1381693 RepID=A0ABP0MWP0_9DINO